MLVIRMQRTGRKGHAQFRVVVQDARRTPTSGRLVAHLGHFNPHTKEAVVNKEKAGFYLEHGAQPSERVARLFKSQGIKLPAWVKLSADKQRAIRNVEKLRKNRPAEVEAPAEEPEKPAEAEEAPAEEQSTEEQPQAEEKPTEETPAEKAEA